MKDILTPLLSLDHKKLKQVGYIIKYRIFILKKVSLSLLLLYFGFLIKKKKKMSLLNTNESEYEKTRTENIKRNTEFLTVI